MQVKTINRILPNMKMVLTEGEKSFNSRTKKAQLMSNHFHLALTNIPEKTLSKSQLKELIWQVTYPVKPDINIFSPKDSAIAHMEVETDINLLNTTNYDHEIMYKNYNLHFENENDIIKTEHPIIIHEIRHLFDYMCNPKYLMTRGSKFINRDYIKKYNEIISYIKQDKYKPKTILGIFKKQTFEPELREKLSGLDNDFIINLLQRARYTIKTELNAYKDTEMVIFLKSPFSLNNLISLADFHLRINSRFNFKEKYRVLNKLLKEYIQTERTKFASELQQKDKIH